ncbi:hypothetical protein MMC13_007013 [Lambiella insularis]|nr:hypothetical protein [Lambiella insularis]
MSVHLRRTRFVCVSDTHNASPATGAFKLPKGDVLIHAGDLTKQGTLTELQKAIEWIENSDFETKIVVAGNHDVTLDSAFCGQHALDFHNQYPQSSEDCIRLLQRSPKITFLSHQSKEIKLTKEGGPRTHFKVFGSPHSPARGLWAFSYEPDDAHKIWNEVPLDADVVITHTPPKFHCDDSRNRGSAGCEILRQKLWRVRPRLAVCGHVHEGRGMQRVQWDLTCPNIQYKEKGTYYWTDPAAGNKKQSYVDLSSGSGEPLKNDGATPKDDSQQKDKTNEVRWASSHATLPAPEGVASKADTSPTGMSSRKATRESTFSFSWIGSQVTEAASHIQTVVDASNPVGKQSAAFTSLSVSSSESATRGYGGAPPSSRCDLEALSGRMGRQETCVINAAIMASSWPHRTAGSTPYNKPIVVDIDLPTWESHSGLGLEG